MYFHNSNSLCLKRGAFVQLLVATMRRERYCYDPLVLELAVGSYYDLSTITTVDVKSKGNELADDSASPPVARLNDDGAFRYHFTTTILEDYRTKVDYRGFVTWGSYGPKKSTFTTKKNRPWIVIGSLSNDRLLVVPLTTNQFPHSSQSAVHLGRFYTERPSVALISQLQTIDEWELNVLNFQKRLDGTHYFSLVESVASFLVM